MEHHEQIMETLLVNNISLGNRSLIVGVLYRPQMLTYPIFNPGFDNLLMRLTAEEKPVICWVILI